MAPHFLNSFKSDFISAGKPSVGNAISSWETNFLNSRFQCLVISVVAAAIFFTNASLSLLLLSLFVLSPIQQQSFRSSTDLVVAPHNGHLSEPTRYETPQIVMQGPVVFSPSILPRPPPSTPSKNFFKKLLEKIQPS